MVRIPYSDAVNDQALHCLAMPIYDISPFLGPEIVNPCALSKKWPNTTSGKNSLGAVDLH
jgi:hypothetical protein